MESAHKVFFYMKFQYWNNLKISQNSLEYVNSTGRNS